MSRWFRRHIAIPADHGSWVFLGVPLLLGVVAGWPPRVTSLYLIVAALTAFLARQPATLAVKCLSGRRSRADLGPALLWVAIWGGIAALHALGLALRGHGRLLLLAVPAAPIFAWYLALVARRDERRQMGVELLAIGVFALSAPAAYALGEGALDRGAAWLWLLCWAQGAASIVHAFLRLTQRAWKNVPSGAALWKPALPSLVFATANLLGVALLGRLGQVAIGLTAAFVIPWLDAIHGTLRPAVGFKPQAIGFRQLGVTLLFAVAFLLAWR